MKVASLLFLLLTVSCAAFMPETSSAASQQHVSGSDRTRNRAGLTAENRPKQPPAGPKQLLPRNAASLRQPASAGSGGSAKGGSIKSGTTNRALPARLMSVRPRAAWHNPSLSPSPENVRHRGPNSSAVSGSANSKNSNPGAISGTGMHRRP